MCEVLWLGRPGPGGPVCGACRAKAWHAVPLCFQTPSLPLPLVVLWGLQPCIVVFALLLTITLRICPQTILKFVNSHVRLCSASPSLAKGFQIFPGLFTEPDILQYQRDPPIFSEKSRFPGENGCLGSLGPGKTSAPPSLDPGKTPGVRLTILRSWPAASPHGCECWGRKG